MSQLPTRTTLQHQVVGFLRQGILDSRWKGELPSEAELCRELQVGRMTLRRALAQLDAEKWIGLGGHGRRHRITRRSRKQQVSTARTIRMLTPYGVAELNSTDNLLIEALSEVVSTAGYRLQIEHHPKVHKTFTPAKLERLNALPDTAGWLLYHTTEPIQRWFSTGRLPTVVAGRIFGDLQLPAVYNDGVAAAHHAAGRLFSAGQRDLIYFRSKLTSLGDRLASEAFVAEATRLGARARIVICDATADSVGKAMMDLLVSRPSPRGYVTGSPGAAITVLCRLLAAGVRVPEEASVIAMWDDEDLDMTYPTLARYRCDGKLMGRQIGKMLLDLIRHGSGKVCSIPFIPKYVAGGSMRSATS